VIMYAYIAWDLFTNLETFSTIIDFQKKCYGKYTPKYVFCMVTKKKKKKKETFMSYGNAASGCDLGLYSSIFLSKDSVYFYSNVFSYHTHRRIKLYK
jgi:hypothetical protein